ncbi:hypothetical protein HY837_06160 [archaeon]|nr:hypothetical protein [archaeon]
MEEIKWEEIKGINKGRVLTLSEAVVNETYNNVARIGDNLYIKLSSIPFAVSDQLEDVEDVNGESYGNLITALELSGLGETDKDFLYKKKGIGDIVLEKTRLIPLTVNQKVYVGLELTLQELEKRYFENEPEQFIAGKIRLQQLLDQKFDEYILKRKQQQLDLYKEGLETTISEVERREKIEEYLKSKLLSLKNFSFQELRAITDFSFETMNQERREDFLKKVKSNHNRLQQYSDEFLDLINVVVLGNVASDVRAVLLEYLSRQAPSEHNEAEKQAIEQGLFVRLFKTPLTEEEFEGKYGKTTQEKKEDINKRRTLFQRHLGKEILDQFLSIDLEDEETSLKFLGEESTKKSLRKAYSFGEEADELGVIRHNLSAQDIVGVESVFDYSKTLLSQRIAAVKTEVLFEDPEINSLKASWLYTNAAIVEWYTKIQKENLDLTEHKTENLAKQLKQVAKKMQSGEAAEKDFDKLNKVTKGLNDVAGRQEMLNQRIVGIFDKKRRNELMKESE